MPYIEFKPTKYVSFLDQQKLCIFYRFIFIFYSKQSLINDWKFNYHYL
jgi:hypothetical protein